MNQEPSQPKIICMMRVKNEERWIAQALEAASRVADSIVILDDGSTDGTPEICRAHPKVVRYEYQNRRSLDEARDKDVLLRSALAENPDWLLALDGDEVLEDAAASTIRREIAVCPPEVTALGFHWLYMWNSPHEYRVDGKYWPPALARLFRVTGLRMDPRKLRFTRTEHGGNLHCGSIPGNLPGLLMYIDVYVKHYGYLDKSDREMRLAFYERHDPHCASKGSYEHLISEEGMILKQWRERSPSEVMYSDQGGDFVTKPLPRQTGRLGALRSRFRRSCAWLLRIVAAWGITRRS